MVEISENFLEFFFEQFSYLALNAPFSRGNKPYGGIPREGGGNREGREEGKGAIRRVLIILF
jgi:hypothetical protein